MQVSLSDKSFLPKTALIFSVKKVTKMLQLFKLFATFYLVLQLNSIVNGDQEKSKFFTKHFHSLIHDI